MSWSIRRRTRRPSLSAPQARLVHMMIFLLIAGTATPAFLLATSGTFRLTCVITMWALTAAAAALRLAWMSAPELVAGSMFVGLAGSLFLRCRVRGSMPGRRQGP